ncbi:DHA2 family efflux MFS transporter permease subunit [Streptomyces sp. NPDC092296]|uniref:DHA2 family efflux MFS transporter permease subunit n=1 Tax=Streptomyces sp. NPDC092296 TaxID=3366012 RepID=UPI00381D40B8
MPTAPTPPNTPPDPRRWWALTAVVLSVLVISFDLTILNVALPTMATELHASTSQQQWIIDSYTVVFAAAMLPAGLLGDRFGRRRMLTVGLALFGTASLLGMLADSPGTVIAARAVMGVGGALIMPLSMAVVPGLFPVKEQGRAIGALASALAAGMPLGPLVGGLLLNHFWWGSVFLVNLPLVAIGIIACVLLIPESRDPAAPRIDLVATVLAAGGLGSLTYGIIEGPTRGWSDGLVVATLGAAVAGLTVLVLRSLRQRRPMLDLSLLRDRGYRWSALAATLVSVMVFGGFFVLPLYFQAVLGTDAFGTGLRLMPMMGGLLVASRITDRLLVRLGARTLITAGLALVAAALLLGSRTGTGDGYGFAACWLPLLGLGMGLSIIPAMGAALATLTPERAGVGSGLLQTLRQVGGAIGVAAFGSLLAGAYTARLDTTGLPAAAARTARDSVAAADAVAQQLHDLALTASAHAAYVHAMDRVLLVAGVVAVVSAVLVGARMPGRAAAAPVTPAPGGPEAAPLAAMGGDRGESSV